MPTIKEIEVIAKAAKEIHERFCLPADKFLSLKHRCAGPIGLDELFASWHLKKLKEQKAKYEKLVEAVKYYSDGPAHCGIKDKNNDICGDTFICGGCFVKARLHEAISELESK